MKNLNDIDKKNLQKLAVYMRASGLKYGNIEFYVEDQNLDMRNVNNFTNNWTVEIPEWAKTTLQKVLNICEPKIEYIENYSYNNLDMDISTTDKLLTVQQNYGHYEEGDEQYDELENDEAMKEVFKDLFENPEIRREDGELILRYEGSGDSGFLEDYFVSGEPVPASAENLCYDFLESRHGGWEINEGSNGEFVFDLTNETISLRHTYMEEQQNSEILFELNFGN